VSNGRFTLGIGASGPQVIEGFHGVPYHAPLGRTREIVEICRQVWRRERVQHQGKHHNIPLPAEQGTGLGKPLKLINHPVRERISYPPGKPGEAWAEPLAAGKPRRGPSLPELDVVAQAPLAIGDGTEELRELIRPHIALYVGGMGAKGKNFYNNLARRYGYEA